MATASKVAGPTCQKGPARPTRAGCQWVVDTHEDSRHNYGMSKAATRTFDSKGNITSRTVYTNPTANAVTKITQVPRPNGEWWNIKIERIGR